MPTPLSTSTASSGMKPSTDPSAPAIEVAGSVQTERHFEWNLGRLLFQREGESNARAWTVRVLSILFVFPVVLTAIVDLGRRLGYAIGNVSPTVGKYFDGKSWSLIEKLSSAAEKASSIFNSTPKGPTLQDLNRQSTQAMQSAVVKLIDGFRKLDGGCLGHDSFSTPTAKAGEKQIDKAQKELAQAVHVFLSHNVAKTEDYAAQLENLKGYIRKLIQSEAADDFYIENKTLRTGPRQLVATVAFNEFLKALEETFQPVFADQFIRLAIQEPDVAQRLKMGVTQEILTPAQAKQAIEQYAPVVYSQHLETGFSEASTAVQELLDSARTNELVSPEEAEAINSKIQPDVAKLVTAAVQQIARKYTPRTNDAIVREQLSSIADQLMAEKRLDPQNKTTFLIDGETQFLALKAVREAESEAQKQLREQAELREKQAAEAAEAQRIEQVQKAADQAELLGQFKDFLALIAKKQTKLDDSFHKHDQMVIEQQQIANDMDKLLKTEVVMLCEGNQVKMGLLKASAVYYQEKVRISRLNKTDAEKNQMMSALINNDKHTIDLIEQLKKVDEMLTQKLHEMATLSEKIKSQYGELIHLIGVYNVFAKNNINRLEDANRKEIGLLGKSVSDTQKRLDTRYSNLRLRSDPTLLNQDEAGNRAEVEALLKDYRASSGEDETLPSAEEPGFVGKVWNVATASLRGVWNYGLVPIWNHAIASRE